MSAGRRRSGDGLGSARARAAGSGKRPVTPLRPFTPSKGAKTDRVIYSDILGASVDGNNVDGEDRYSVSAASQPAFYAANICLVIPPPPPSPARPHRIHRPVRGQIRV